jgi:hypothetical protein
MHYQLEACLKESTFYVYPTLSSNLFLKNTLLDFCTRTLESRIQAT